MPQNGKKPFAGIAKLPNDENSGTAIFPDGKKSFAGIAKLQRLREIFQNTENPCAKISPNGKKPFAGIAKFANAVNRSHVNSQQAKISPYTL